MKAMRVTKDKRKLNKLVHRYHNGQQWIESCYDPMLHGWRESPSNHNLWGVPKYNDCELEHMIETLNDLIDTYDNSSNLSPNQIQAVDYLLDIGVLIKKEVTK